MLIDTGLPDAQRDSSGTSPHTSSSVDHGRAAFRCTLNPELTARFLIDCVLQSAITYNKIHYLQDNLGL